MRRRAALALAFVAAAVAACIPTAPGPPSPTEPPPTVAGTPVPPTPTPTVMGSPTATAGALPEGFAFADIPSAGIRLPVPAGWEQLDAAALADEAVQADVVARYPGMGGFLEAAKALGDRATPAFLALDPAAVDGDVALAPSVSVLVAQPSVSGPVLDFVTGFIADALAETFGSPPPDRSRVETPAGEAVRLAFDLPPDGDTPMTATAWVIGAEAGTLLVTVVGPAGVPPVSDPDGLIGAAQLLP